MGRPSKADREGAKTGDVVYARAVDLIYERGFHGTSLRDVAKAVGVQMSSLYYYYPSKQDLLMTIMTNTMRELTGAIVTAIDAVTDPRQRLEAAVHAHIMFHADRLKESVVADTELRALEPAERKKIVALRDKYERLFRELLEEGQSAGVFKITDPRLTTRALLGATTDVANWFNPGGPLTLEKVSALYCSVFIDGIGTPQVPASSRRRASAGVG